MRGNLPQAFVHALMLECAARLAAPAEGSGSSLHLGDPRSHEAPYDESVKPEGEQPSQPAADGEGGKAG
jgi:hypothetical protein